jgi:hypothetical protein
VRNPYAFVPNEVLEQAESVRASLPNKYCDPRIAAQLYDEIFDEYRLCDDIGIHIVTNEHHSGANNLWAVSRSSPALSPILPSTSESCRSGPWLRYALTRSGWLRNTRQSTSCRRVRLEIGFVKSGATEMV